MSSPLRRPPSALSETDLSGRQLGDFHLLRRLGHGAMSDVYLAEQARLNRRVAVKVLKPELAGDRTYLQRFELEAQAAASLIHANIVQIYEVGCVDDLHYIAQEYVQGMNLREYLVRHGPPDLSHALSIMRQVAAALAKAAEQGVVHRDIKPENIMLTPGGEVKVADFGLARLTREGAATELTQVGITLGTPLYMSPEQVEGKPLDPRSDIYSFGVTCFHMLSGKPPFGGETALSVAVQHLKKQPEPLESLRSDLPPALCRIVHQMLAKDPARRFANARDLLRELRRVQIEHFGDDWPEDLPAWDSLAAEMPVDPRDALTEQLESLMKTMATTRRRPRGRLWLAAGMAGALALGGVAAWCTILPHSLLAGAKAPTQEIPPQPSVVRQYILASQINNEAAWKSIKQYFPLKKGFVDRAQQQLAMIYLRENRLNDAMTIFNQLAGPNNDRELQAFGLAGEYAVLSIRGDTEGANGIFMKLLPLRQELTSRPMAELVAHALRHNSSRQGSQADREWDDWMQKQFPEGS